LTADVCKTFFTFDIYLSLHPSISYHLFQHPFAWYVAEMANDIHSLKRQHWSYLGHVQQIRKLPDSKFR
jgi:hypothetical protein